MCMDYNLGIRLTCVATFCCVACRPCSLQEFFFPLCNAITLVMQMCFCCLAILWSFVCHFLFGIKRVVDCFYTGIYSWLMGIGSCMWTLSSQVMVLPGIAHRWYTPPFWTGGNPAGASKWTPLFKGILDEMPMWPATRQQYPLAWYSYYSIPWSNFCLKIHSHRPPDNEMKRIISNLLELVVAINAYKISPGNDRRMSIFLCPRVIKYKSILFEN